MRWVDKPLVAKPAQWAKDNDVWPFGLDAIYEAIHTGALPATKVGRHYAVTRIALIEFFGADDVKAQAEAKHSQSPIHFGPRRRDRFFQSGWPQ